MATIRLIPSTYYLSNSSLSVSSIDSAYTNTDSTTYATVSTTSTSSRYIYLRGFDFSTIPSGATVNSFSIKFKANESGMSTSSSYRPYLCDGTTTLTGTSSAITTTVTTQTFSDVSADWDTIVGYGSDFGIRFTVRRSGGGGSSSSTGYLYLYGAEIEVDYTLSNPATVTSTLTGDGTIDPSGTTSTYEGVEYTLTIAPTDENAEVTATLNGTDVTSQLVQESGGGTESCVLGNYTLVSGGFNSSGASYFSGIVGNGADASQTSSNYYSSGSGTIAVFTYDMGIEIPSSATITRVYCEVNGHAESTSNSNEYMCAMLISGSTELTEELNFKDIGTSNSTQTLECETLPTVAQLAEMKLQCRLGYYGGAINGATAYVVYTVAGVVYTYTYTVSGDATIAVTIGGGQATATIYFKNGSTWTSATAVYKKVNGAWVQQSDLSNVFQTGVNYRRG